MNSPLYNKLIDYSKKDIYPFHMPGHKRQVNKLGFENIANLDITEIEGFDNLHNPKEVILEAEKNASLLYQTLRTYFLINGSTSGILAAITSQCKKKSKVIVGRNCHRSVYNAIELNELDPIYVYPENVSIKDKVRIVGGINPEQIEELLRANKDVSAVIITSPTYDGVISDIQSISRIARKYNTLLIVDEAHGAHLGLSKHTENSAINQGADIVIQSLHKTLPALTQTALLHIVTEQVERDKLEHHLSIFQTSSPSYILMASIDLCIGTLLDQKDTLFRYYIENIQFTRKQLSCLKNIHLVGEEVVGHDSVYKYDLTKLVFSTRGTNINGHQLSNILLEDYKIQIEYASKDYVLALTSIFDERKGYRRLIDAIINIDSKLHKYKENDDISYMVSKPSRKYIIPEVNDLRKRKETIGCSIGKVCANYVIPYPPGIPFIVPGEIIEKEMALYLEELIKHNIEIIGVNKDKTIWIVD